MSALTKRQEMLFKALRTRHGRKKSEYCLCDGLRSSIEVLQCRSDLVELIVLREDKADLDLPPCNAERVILPAADFAELTATVNSQGLLVLSRCPEYLPLTAPIADPFVLILDRVGDPGNFGTILRTARAAGLKEVWLTKGSVDPWSEKVVRSASGAQFAVKLRMAQTLEEAAEHLKQQGYPTIWRTLPAGGESLFRAEGVFDHSAVIFGCEATGVADLAGSRSLHIPMPGDAESLNVAQAATIVLFEYVRRLGL